jgi:hypothetical protein
MSGLSQTKDGRLGLGEGHIPPGSETAATWRETIGKRLRRLVRRIRGHSPTTRLTIRGDGKAKSLLQFK